MNTGEEGSNIHVDPATLPNYMLHGLWWVLWLVGIEYLALWWQGLRLPVFHDNLLSLVHGVLYEISKVLVRGLEYMVYTWVWQHWSLPLGPLFPPPAGNPIITFIIVDLAYYWLHRASHEILVLWAIHQVHHSSQDLTVSVGLRHSPLQRIYCWVFFLPLALLGVSPEYALAHVQFNTLYQCWIHTTSIQTLGPLENILNTPSLHRVHHATNIYALDKNYGGVFIVWDRLFGTFQKERPGEGLVYGIIHQPQRYNPLFHQVYYLGHTIEKTLEMVSWKESLQAIIKGPSWVPGSPWTGWQENKIDVTKSQVHLAVRASLVTHLYAFLHFLAALTLTNHLTVSVSGSPVEVFVYGVVVVTTLTSIGILYENPEYTRLMEGCRCGVSLLLCLLIPLSPTPSSITSTGTTFSYNLPTTALLSSLTALYALSLTLWSVTPAIIVGHKECKTE